MSRRPRRERSLEAPPRPTPVCVATDGLPRYAQGADPAPRPPRAPKPSDEIVLRMPRAALDIILSALDERGSTTDRVIALAIRAGRETR